MKIQPRRLSLDEVSRERGAPNWPSRHWSLIIQNRVLSVLGVGFAFFLLTSTACAHQLSDSFLILQVTNSEIIGHWDIALKDLLHARGLDPLDQKFTDLRSFDAEREMTNVHVLSRLRMKIDGVPAEIQPIDY